jgi:hypothetical protein
VGNNKMNTTKMTRATRRSTKNKRGEEFLRDLRWRVAIHEAGHAIAMLEHGVKIDSIVIDPIETFRRSKTRAGGYVEPAPGQLLKLRRGVILSRGDKTRFNRDMVIFCAGPVADAIAVGASTPFFDFGSMEDRRAIIRVCNCVCFGAPKSDRRDYARRMLKRTHRFLSRPEVWDSVKGLAMRLIHDGTMDGKMAEEHYQFDKDYLWPSSQREGTSGGVA